MLETVLRLMEENKLFTHRSEGGVYCLVNSDEDIVIGDGKDKGREFYLYVEMLVIDRGTVREHGHVRLRDREDWYHMRAITPEDDIRFLGTMDHMNGDPTNH